MKKYLTTTLSVACLLAACKKEESDPQKAYFYGKWNVVHMLAVETQDSLSLPLTPGLYTYNFMDDGQVYIYQEGTGNQVLGWELVPTTVDSLLFSSGTYFHILEKEDQKFKVEYDENQAHFEYELAR